MKIYDLKEAENLMQLTIWVRDNEKERRFLQKTEKQVLINKGRKSMIVKKGGLLALFVNEVS